MKSAIACAALLIVSAGLARAVVIQPDTATASSRYSPLYDPIYTIDGSGLQGDLQDLPDHAPYGPSNHWTTVSGELVNAWIEWGFSDAQTLDTIYLWNHQSYPPPGGDIGYDVGDFELTFFDASNSVIGVFSSTLAFDSPSAQEFSFGKISGIKSVRFDIDSVQSSTTWTGLAEVAFELKGTATVPDTTATVPLLAVTLGALGLAVGRRRFA